MKKYIFINGNSLATIEFQVNEFADEGYILVNFTSTESETDYSYVAVMMRP